MRKQYHFMPSTHGFFAWDVDRLIDITKNFKVQEVDLGAIKELGQRYWFPKGVAEKATCRAIIEHARLMQQVDLRHPIILAVDGRVMDGMHRVGKAIIQGEDTIKAVQFETDPEPDYTDVFPDELPY